MKRYLISTVALVLLGAGPALSQGAETPLLPEADAPQQAPAVTNTAPEGDAAGMYGAFGATAVSDLIGMNVLDQTGADIGEVEGLVSASSNVQAVVGVGGFLGFGEHDVAIPLADFTLSEGALMLPEMSQEQLEAMPAYGGDLEELPRDVTVAGDPIIVEEAPAPLPAD